jgi:uncharacterized protein
VRAQGPKARRSGRASAVTDRPPADTSPGSTTDESVTVLLDGNVLVALTDQAHVHHVAASVWFAAHSAPFATCPITQGTPLRVRLRLGAAPDIGSAMALLDALTAHARHRFWPDTLGYGAIDLRGLVGHRQITDAYLAALARHHRGRLATFDQGLVALHPDVAVRVG